MKSFNCLCCNSTVEMTEEKWIKCLKPDSVVCAKCRKEKSSEQIAQEIIGKLELL